MVFPSVQMIKIDPAREKPKADRPDPSILILPTPNSKETKWF